MHRVELKEPCNKYTLYSLRMFLMHRVELKGYRHFRWCYRDYTFLMHRVELKGCYSMLKLCNHEF